MEKTQLQIVVTADAGNANEALSRMNSNMETVSRTAEGIGAGVDMGAVNAALQETAGAAETAGSSLSQIGAGVDMGDVNAALQELANVIRECTSTMASLISEAIKFGNETGKAANKASDGLDEMGDAAKDSGEDLDEMGSNGKSSLDKFRAAVAGTSSSIKKMCSLGMTQAAALGSFIGTMAANLAGKIAGAIKNMAASCVSSIIGMGAAMEQSRLKFHVLLGDVAKGNALFAQLKNFANVTPFSTDDIVQAGQTLLSFGIAAGDVKKHLTAVGNAASATGTGAKEMAAIYGKALVKGKVDSEGLNQMMERGVPIVKALARQMNVAESSIYKLASQGKVSSDNLQAAFLALSEKGGAFGGMMERQAETVGGKWSTLQGKLGDLAGTLGEQLAPATATVVDGLIGMADSLAESLASGAAISELVNYIASVIPTVTAGLFEVGKQLVWLGASLKIIWDTVAGGIKLAWGLVEVVFSAILQDIEFILRGFIEAWNKIAGVVGLDNLTLNLESKPGDLLGGNKLYNHGLDTGMKGYDQAVVGFDNTLTWAMKADRTMDKAKGATVESVSDIVKRAADAVKKGLESNSRTDSNLAAGEENGQQQDATETLASGSGVNRSVDSLARIGLYNYGVNAEDALDRRRNALLEGIRDGIEALKGGISSGAGMTEVSIV